jgi:hypothetical protein
MEKLKLVMLIKNKVFFSLVKNTVNEIGLLFENKNWDDLKNYEVKEYLYKKKYYLQWSVKNYDNNFELFSEAWFAEENKRMVSFEYWDIIVNPHPVNSKLWVEENSLRKLDLFKKNQEELRRYNLLVNLYTGSLKNFLSFSKRTNKYDFNFFLEKLNDESAFFFRKNRKLDFLKTNNILFKKVGELNRVRDLLLEEEGLRRPFLNNVDIIVFKSFFLKEYFLEILNIFSSFVGDEGSGKGKTFKRKGVKLLRGWTVVENEQARPEFRKIVRAQKKRLGLFLHSYFNYLDFKFFKTDYVSLINYIRKIRNVDFLEKIFLKYSYFENTEKISVLDVERIVGLQTKKLKALGISDSDLSDTDEGEDKEGENMEDEEGEDFLFNFKTYFEYVDEELERFEIFLLNDSLTDEGFLDIFEAVKKNFASEIQIDLGELVYCLGLEITKERFKDSYVMLNAEKLFSFQEKTFVNDSGVAKSLILNFLNERKFSGLVGTVLKSLPALSDYFEKDKELSFNILEGVELKQKEYFFLGLKNLKEQGKVSFFGSYLEFLDRFFKINKIFDFYVDKKESISYERSFLWYSYEFSLEDSLQEDFLNSKELLGLRLDLLTNFTSKWDSYMGIKNAHLHKYNLEFYNKILKVEGSFKFPDKKTHFNYFVLFCKFVGFLSKTVFFLKSLEK